MNSHIAELHVDMLALEHNYGKYRELIPDHAALMPIIKADAYGSNVLPIARKLMSLGVQYLAVAVLEEAILLRREGIRTKILVLNPDIITVELAWNYQVEIEIYSINLLKHVATIADQRREDILIHLKIDTGMHRLGVLPSEMNHAIDIIRQCRYIKVAGIMSHLASSEDPQDDAFTLAQMQLFETLKKQVEEALSCRPLSHISNTAAIVRFDNTPYDLCRIGIGLYGVNLARDHHLDLRVVHSLTAHIIQIKTLPAGASIGYSRKTILGRDSVIAIVDIGYADGIPRILGNGRFQFVVNGKKANTVGNISMDSLAIDVTDIEGVAEYDIVEIFGKQQSIIDLAHAADTIPYEILCGISNRITRVFT